MATTVSTMASTSVVDSTIGTASRAGELGEQAGLALHHRRAAAGPMFPSPSTAVPSETTATTRRPR